MFYFLTISGAALIIALVNFWCGEIHGAAEFIGILCNTVLGVAAIIAVDGVLAFLIRRLPEKWFSPMSKTFDVGKGERMLYRKIKLNSWKKHIPEWGCFTGFHKDKLREPNDSAYIGRFLIESNYGVAGHIAGAFLGYAVMLLPFLSPLTMALPIAVVNFILNLLPTMILRYNTPALRGIYRRNLSRELRGSDHGSDADSKDI